MELAVASAIGVLTALAIYLLLRARSFDVILGMTFLSYATNLLIFAGGRFAQRPGAGVARRRAGRADASHRPAPAGLDADRHRDRVCDDRGEPGAGDPQP